jgi:putative membrane protein
MHTLGLVLTGLVAAIHVYILVLEMFLWTKPRGRKVFRLTPERAQDTKVMAQNQGLYNGFLAAGLIWALLSGPEQLLARATFFLGCVAVAGIYGAATVMRSILYVQTIPALLALAALWIHR